MRLLVLQVSLGVLLLLSDPGLVRAQFPTTEVSEPGSPPFELSKQGWAWEDLSAEVPEVSYNIFRARPGGVFDCIESNVPTNSWLGDPDDVPAEGLWWYLVNADDGWSENRLGENIPVGERCSCSGAEEDPTTDITLEEIGFFDSPISLTASASDRTRVYVALRSGVIEVVNLRDGGRSTFLDIRADVRSCGEQGLLSLALHPEFDENGRLFLFYTVEGGVFDEGVARVVEYTALGPDSADPGSARVIYESDRPTCYHVGGQIAFGPHDGYLYVAFGDGDYQDRPQNLGSESGKILRLDVDAAQPFGIPPTNPFVDEPGALPEVWAYGLRNPWRFSFDRATGDLYIGDVGDSCAEEVSLSPAAGGGGENFGWPMMEATRCLDPSGACNVSCEDCVAVADCGELTPPLVDYDYITFQNCSVIGGFVYRGCSLPAFVGRYFYSDWCAGLLWSFELEGGRPVRQREWDFGQGGPVSFGEDARGEIYILTGDRVLKIVPG